MNWWERLSRDPIHFERKPDDGEPPANPGATMAVCFVIVAVALFAFAVMRATVWGGA